MHHFTRGEVAPMRSAHAHPFLPSDQIDRIASGLSFCSESQDCLGSSRKTYAKSSTPPLAKPLAQKGKLEKKGEKREKQSKFQRSRARRFIARAAARELLMAEGEKAKLEYPMNYHKTAKCGWIPHSNVVQVRKSKETGVAHYRGLINCSNPYACPFCAPKIEEQRRKEIAHAMDWAYANGCKAIMVTLTFPHVRKDRIGDLLKKQAAAFKGLRGRNAWTKLTKKIGFVGLIRALEVTYGDRGWHPHTHELWIVSPDTDVKALQEKVTRQWFNRCLEHGLVADTAKGRRDFFAHAVNITDECKASEYLAKQGGKGKQEWGIDRELAKRSSKQAKTNKGRTPFGLLEEYAEDGNQKSGWLFVEYVKAMKHRPVLYWSAGLKDKVGLDEVTDEDATEESSAEDEFLTGLTLKHWRLVTRAKVESELLDTAEDEGLAGIVRLLERLAERFSVEFHHSELVMLETSKTGKLEKTDLGTGEVEDFKEPDSPRPGALRSPDPVQSAEKTGGEVVCTTKPLSCLSPP